MSSQNPTPNPILDATVGVSLDELFSRDPEGLADCDLDAMVSALEAQRVAWETGQTAAKVRKSKAKPKVEVDLLSIFEDVE
jgi:hypothetical protein